MMRKTITSKIVISYLAIILISLIFVGIFFSLAAKQFIEGRIRYELGKDADIIANTLKRDAGVLRKEAMMQRRELQGEGDMALRRMQQLMGDTIRKSISLQDSSHFVINRDFDVLFARSYDDTERFKEQVLPNVRTKLEQMKKTSLNLMLDGKEYILLLTPVEPEGKYWVVSYTSIGGLSQLSRSLLEVFILTLAVTLVLALAFGTFIARSVAKPIVVLKNRAESLSKRDFDSRVEIRTGDEIEELAGTIDKMAFELKEYDIAQKKFLQNASHELKTPLMSIQGYAEGIKDGVFDDNEHALQVIVDESKRLKSLVEEIIYLSKLETMEEFYRLSPESINDVVLGSVDKVRSLAVRNSIEIETGLSQDAVIELDRDKMTQALINILGNCLRYAKTRIKVYSINDGNQVELVISDDGDGFDPEELKHVFVRFYKGKKGNTGLGLAITKVVVEKHGGTITAMNGENGGAVFIIKLRKC